MRLSFFHSFTRIALAREPGPRTCIDLYVREGMQE